MPTNFRACCVLLLVLSACATTEPRPAKPLAHSPRIANLRMAAKLPWTDEGRCVVREASQPWGVMTERCYHALDKKRLRFNDTERRCSVASVDAADVEAMVGICLLAQPELLVGAVVVIGVVVVAAAIAEELESHERWRRAHPEEEGSSEAEGPVAQTQPSSQEPMGNGEPKPEGLGRDWFPPEPPDSSLEPREPRSECTPRRVPPKGGHPFHNTCADNVPHNAFRGANALVNGKAFDALQPATRTLWEVKTDNFDTYTPALQRIVIDSQGPNLRSELALARACGFDFRVGVRSAAHKAELERRYPDLRGLIVVMNWC